MHLKTTSVVLVLAAVLLLAQTVSIVDATHKSKNDKDPRKVAEEREKDLDKVKETKNIDKRKAFNDYLVTFKEWKIAKQEYKTAKSSGDQTVIDAKKIILDKAIITKDEALKKYVLSKEN